MSAQPAYSPQYSAYPRSIEQTSRPGSISVIHGNKPKHEAKGFATSPWKLFALGILAICLCTVLGVISLNLSAAAVSTSMDSQTLSSQIEEAKTEGTALEVTESLLSNPTRVRQQAEKLGMATDANAQVIDMEKDVVCTDDAGNLSLSASIETAIEQNK